MFSAFYVLLETLQLNLTHIFQSIDVTASSIGALESANGALVPKKQ